MTTQITYTYCNFDSYGANALAASPPRMAVAKCIRMLVFGSHSRVPPGGGWRIKINVIFIWDKIKIKNKINKINKNNKQQ